MRQAQKVCMIVLALCWFMNMFGNVNTYSEGKMLTSQLLLKVQMFQCCIHEFMAKT